MDFAQYIYYLMPSGNVALPMIMYDNFAALEYLLRPMVYVLATQ
jgi:hypothetical protein